MGKNRHTSVPAAARRLVETIDHETLHRFFEGLPPDRQRRVLAHASPEVRRVLKRETEEIGK